MSNKYIQKKKNLFIGGLEVMRQLYRLLSSHHLMVIIMIVLLHMTVFALAFSYRGIYTGDSPEYLMAAENISMHAISYNGYLNEKENPALYSLRPPGYPIFILLCKAFFSSDLTVLLIQNLCSILLLCFIYMKLQHVNSIKKHKWLVISGLVFFPVYLILINMIMADALLAFLLVLSWLFLESFVKTKIWYYLLLYNICLSFAAMTKPVMMYFWIPNLLFSGYLIWKIKKIYPVLMAMVLVLTIGAWSYRNYLRTGYFHYSSIKTQNLLELSAGAVISYMYDNNHMKEHRKATLTNAEFLPSYREKSEFMLNEAQKVILQHPFLYTLLHVKGMFNVMLSPGRVDIETFFVMNLDNPVSILYEVEKKGLFKGVKFYLGSVNAILVTIVFLIVIWNVFSFLLLLAAFCSNKIEITQRIFLFLLLFYIVFACGLGGYARFKTSIYPFILYLLPFGYQVTLYKIKKTLGIGSCITGTTNNEKNTDAYEDKLDVYEGS